MDSHLNEELSLYLDGELDAGARGRVEAHLAGCAQCRAALEGLRSLMRRAAALDDAPPARDLWPDIARRLNQPAEADVIPLAPRRRRFSFTVPQLAAAAVALMALSATAALMMTGAQGAAPAADGGATATPTLAALDAMPAPFSSYDAAIQDLEAALAARRSTLDTATVRVVEQSLQVIDRAIAQAVAALARDPNDPYLNSHLRNALDRKLEVLRRAAALPRVS